MYSSTSRLLFSALLKRPVSSRPRVSADPLTTYRTPGQICASLNRHVSRRANEYPPALLLFWICCGADLLREAARDVKRPGLCSQSGTDAASGCLSSWLVHTRCRRWRAGLSLSPPLSADLYVQAQMDPGRPIHSIPER